MNILLRILLFSVILPIVFCKPCMEARLEVQQNTHIGVFIPRCDELNADLYKPLQCHGSTGYCWCVHYETVFIMGARPKDRFINLLLNKHFIKFFVCFF